MLRAESLTVSIAGREVCRDLDLVIEPGSRWAILGVNGVALLLLEKRLHPPHLHVVGNGEEIGSALIEPFPNLKHL